MIIQNFPNLFMATAGVDVVLGQPDNWTCLTDAVMVWVGVAKKGVAEWVNVERRDVRDA
jgi:hypothetical protein